MRTERSEGGHSTLTNTYTPTSSRVRASQRLDSIWLILSVEALNSFGAYEIARLMMYHCECVSRVAV
jgi:hypothetical protein